MRSQPFNYAHATKVFSFPSRFFRNVRSVPDVERHQQYFQVERHYLQLAAFYLHVLLSAFFAIECSCQQSKLEKRSCLIREVTIETSPPNLLCSVQRPVRYRTDDNLEIW